jgi:Calcineurin-like phosphoesterase
MPRKPKNPHAPLPQPIFGEPVFSEGVATPDPTVFKKPHPSDNQLYNRIQSLLTKDVVTFSAAAGKPGDLYTLESALGAHGPAVVQEIQSGGQIVFHAAGDTGASNVHLYGNEIRLSDQVTSDIHMATGTNRPAFLYHLGDVVYNFGESLYYYDQFFEPFRNYPAPIFAIPGNHDSFIIPKTPLANTPLTIFKRNFCSAKRVITPEAASLHRTAMTQPGVYFTLDAPFVRIIGLFSNALEDPGLISSEKGKWKGVPDVQLAYLTAQLQRIKAEKYSGAVLLAVHHPPFSYAPPQRAGGTGGNHSSSTSMLREIDAICKAQSVYPHAFLSGHAHNYQRYTRTVHFGGNDFTVPFVVCGDGGHHVNPLVQSRGGVTPPDPTLGQQVNYLDPNPAVQATALRIEKFDHTNFGYLRITVNKKQLRIEFHPVGRSAPHPNVDAVVVDLPSHRVVSN